MRHCFFIFIIFVIVFVNAALFFTHPNPGFAQAPAQRLILFRARNSLTLYLPGDGSIRLGMLRYEVERAGRGEAFRLNGFATFQYVPFDALPLPICLQVVSGEDTFPQDCQTAVPAANRLRHSVAAADVFWYDPDTAQGRLVSIFSDEQLVGSCPGEQARCEFELPLASSNPQTPIAGANVWQPRVETFEGVPMVLVPAGCFQMGSSADQIDALRQRYEADRGDLFSDEGPQTQFCLERPFWIDRYEVTNRQFSEKRGLADSPGSWDEPERPRENITWFEAVTYCQARGARLPTEAEWEYAARGPQSTEYPLTDFFVPSNAVFDDNSGGEAAFVGSLLGAVSWAGAYDLSGNVWEWTSSLYRSYPYGASDGRENREDTVSERVIRGGSWNSVAFELRTAHREPATPDMLGNDIGFRCARDY